MGPLLVSFFLVRLAGCFQAEPIEQKKTPIPQDERLPATQGGQDRFLLLTLH